MAEVMEEIAKNAIRETARRVRRETTRRVRRETTFDMAKKLLAESDLSIEKISSLCNLPLEKVRELATEKID